jgi:hypothetical protein
MARYSTGVRTGAGSTTLPLISLYNAAAVSGVLREIGLFNTTTTALAVMLARFSTAGTQGAALVESRHRRSSAAASCTAFTTHTGAPTILETDLGYRTTLGAAIGAGVIWTFGDAGLEVGDVGVANGLGVLIATGTGQILDATIVWDE